MRDIKMIGMENIGREEKERAFAGSQSEGTTMVNASSRE